MPTGYTHYIENGSVKTPQEFLTLCLNSFGIGTLDIGIKYKPDLTEDIKKRFQQQIDYHQQRIDKEKEIMVWYQSLSDDELYHKFKTNLDSRREYLKSAKRKAQKSADKYQQFATAIQNWDCSEEFTGLKKFALNQINEGGDVAIECYDKELKKLDGRRRTFDRHKKEYLDEIVGMCQRQIAHHSAQLAESIKRQQDMLDLYRKFKEEIKSL